MTTTGVPVHVSSTLLSVCLSFCPMKGLSSTYIVPNCSNVKYGLCAVGEASWRQISPKCLIWSDVPLIDVSWGRVRQTIAPFVRGFVWDSLGLDRYFGGKTEMESTRYLVPASKGSVPQLNVRYLTRLTTLFLPVVDDVKFPSAPYLIFRGRTSNKLIHKRLPRGGYHTASLPFRRYLPGKVLSTSVTGYPSATTYTIHDQTLLIHRLFSAVPTCDSPSLLSKEGREKTQTAGSTGMNMNPVSEMKASSTGDGAGSKPLRDRPSLLGTL
ncbi:hypothetical protein BDP67DRAFT_603436 [Colletotrichum lupini]|nr:hypothetical protein BDP67DRAFT_603436 [Colletotrichum lupini]